MLGYSGGTIANQQQVVRGVTGMSPQGTGSSVVQALLLAYFANRHGSLFAAQSLVEALLELYRQGCTVEELQSTLLLAALQSGGQLLQPIEQEVLVSWATMVLLTLQLVGVPLYRQVCTTSAARLCHVQQDLPEQRTLVKQRTLVDQQVA